MLAALLSNLLVFAACLGAGLLLYRFLPPALARFEKLVYSCLGGVGLLSLILFLVGQFWFSRSVILLILFAFAVLGVYRMRALPLSLPPLSLRLPPGSALPLLVIAFVLVLTFVAGFALPFGDWSNDAIAYHLLGPKVWLRSALIRPVPDNCLTSFPAAVEVIFAALLSFGGPTAPGLSAFWTFALFLSIAYFLARRFGLSPPQAFWAAALLAAMPAAYSGAHSAFIDAVYASFLLASARILLDAETLPHFAAAGVFAGWAIATKYTGLVALPLLLLAVLLNRAFGSARIPARAFAKGLAVAVTFSILLGSPYYFRNWYFLGTPLYPTPPALLRYFPSRYLTPAAIDSFYRYLSVRGAGLGHNLSAFLLLPFNLTYHTSNFHGAGGIGLAPLAFVPFGMWILRRDAFARGFALLTLLLTIGWFLTQQESRFLSPVYALFAVFAVSGWDYLARLGSRFTNAACALLVLLSVAYGSYMIGRGRYEDVRAAFSSSYAATRNHADVPYLSAFDDLNSDASVRKVLILDRTVAPYYSDKPYVKVIGQWGESPVPDAPTPAQALQILPELNVTHILDVESELAGFQVSPADPRFELVFSQPHQRVYRVK